jgi:hippurate hydrolase
MLDFDAVSFRRDLHAHPELGADVSRTSARVAEALEAGGLEVTREVGGHGVVASVGSGPKETAILLRADMDALPIVEKTDAAHASTIEGRHHGCGHDGHTTMLVLAGIEMAKSPPNRRVHLMFQPDEENGTGARAMIDDGLLDRFPASFAFGLHVMPGLEHGKVASAPGPFCSFEENFEILLRGRGGHASMPNKLCDPLVAGAALVGDLQTIVARNCDPREHAVVSVTNFETDGARNVVPSTVRISGDFRGFKDATAEVVATAMCRISEGVASAYSVSAEVSISRSFAPLTNSEEAVEFAVSAGRRAGLNFSTSYPKCGFSEDFAAVLEQVPGAFFLIGQGAVGNHGRPLHDPCFEFDDSLLMTGAEFWRALVE